MSRRRPKLAVWKFASCDGCQLSLLDLEDELLTLAEALDIAFFRELSSRDSRGPFDLSLVDGSIATARDLDQIREVRRRSRHVVALGACATTGGIQALRNFQSIAEYKTLVYARPEYIDALATSTGIGEHVPVDFELRGCPPNPRQLLEVVSAFLNGRRPAITSHSVCVECKQQGNVCVMVTGTPCLGPVTHAGCGALCPVHNRGCYGCYGPMETPNTAALSRAFESSGMGRREVLHVFRTFTANAPPFRTESTRHE